MPPPTTREGRPEWTNDRAYAHLLGADRSILAWEWLRRDPCYRAAASAKAAPDPSDDLFARRFGLHRFEDPLLGAPAARPIWRSDYDRSVIETRGEPAGPVDDRIRLASLRDASLVTTRGFHHWLISDGLHAIRIDVSTREPSSALLLLHYELSGIAGIAPRIAALERFLTYVREHRFASARRSTNRRQVLVMRVADALAVGADQREIASVLLHSDAASKGWRAAFPSLRSQAQRLVRSAALMAAEGYRSLLR